MKGLGKFIRNILLGINILVLLGIIAGHFFIPKYPPGTHWPLGLLGLVFPFLVLLAVIFSLFWLLFYYKYAVWGILTLAICWSSVSVIFAFHPFTKKISFSAKDSSIKVMSYNLRYFKNFDSSKSANVMLRNRIIDFLEKQNPDILCLQEFYTSENPNEFDNKSFISKKIRYPYRYFSSDHNYGNNHSGVIIFSRFPIIRSDKISLLKSDSQEMAIYADIKKGIDTFRLYTVHLQSIYLSRKDLQHIEKIKQQEQDDKVLKATGTIAKKLKSSFEKRGKEVDILSKAVRKSPYPVMICGDFNDPPNSYSYFKIKGDLKDAFLEKGFGLGRTYKEISPTLRIDYILADTAFQTLDFKVIHKDFSDHYPIVARMKL